MVDILKNIPLETVSPDKTKAGKGDKPVPEKRRRVVIFAEQPELVPGVKWPESGANAPAEFVKQANAYKRGNPEFDVEIIPYYKGAKGNEFQDALLKAEKGGMKGEYTIALMGHSANYMGGTGLTSEIAPMINQHKQKFGDNISDVLIGS